MEVGSQKLNSPRRLFCWSGGGLPGLDIHAGIWKALSEAGIESTANAGTSAGAIVAAFNSAGISNAVALSIILGLIDSDVRKDRFLWKLRIPWVDNFLDAQPIKTLLADKLPDEFRELKKTLSVFVTNEKSASPEEINSDAHYLSMQNAILASMSIMGVFPPVQQYSDGGTTAYLPLPQGWEKFDEVWLLVAKRPLDYHKRTGMLTRLMFNADVLYEDQVCDTIAFARQNHPNVFLVRPDVKTPAGSLHFNHDLIVKAYEYTRDYQAGGRK